MFGSFKYKRLPLSDVILDERNPRIVTQAKLTSQASILEFLFEHENLSRFIKKIAAEGKNIGAERPYVVKAGAVYTVVEGNNRIAAYKVLTGQLAPPAKYINLIPKISEADKRVFSNVDCSIAPDRDSLLAIMANAHFGQGDKSKWGYLGSRKAVFDEWNFGKDISQLADVFDRTEAQIRELILEYLLYLEVLNINWTRAEREKLLNPAIQFNPPVRFLQSKGHKEKIGISYDTIGIKLIFADADAKKKLKHLIYKLVINPTKGLGATATYEQVFADYAPSSGGLSGTTSGKRPANNQAGSSQPVASTSATPPSGSRSGSGPGGGVGAGVAGSTVGASAGGQNSSTPGVLKPNALFSYPVKMNNGVVAQLMREAASINCKQLPASATFLLRNIIESILKEIIDQQKANSASKMLDLEGALNLSLSNNVALPPDDKKILKELSKSHLSYLNLGAHANIIPTYERVMSVRGCVDQFIKRNV